jgi:hypothetical protein
MRRTTVSATPSTEPTRIRCLVGYTFDDNNQLAVTLANDAGATSDPFTFSGRILINDNHDLAISLARGGATKILGDSGVTSLEAGRNDLASFNADDLLILPASTTNIFPSEDAVVLPAQIQV